LNTYLGNVRSFFRSGNEFKLIWFYHFGFQKVPFWVTWHICLYNHWNQSWYISYGPNDLWSIWYGTYNQYNQYSKYYNYYSIISTHHFQKEVAELYSSWNLFQSSRNTHEYHMERVWLEYHNDQQTIPESPLISTVKFWLSNNSGRWNTASRPIWP